MTQPQSLRSALERNGPKSLMSYLAGTKDEWADAFSKAAFFPPDHIRSLCPDDFEAIVVTHTDGTHYRIHINSVSIHPIDMRRAILWMHAREPSELITLDLAANIMTEAIEFARGEHD